MLLVTKIKPLGVTFGPSWSLWAEISILLQALGGLGVYQQRVWEARHISICLASGKAREVLQFRRDCCLVPPKESWLLFWEASGFPGALGRPARLPKAPIGTYGIFKGVRSGSCKSPKSLRGHCEEFFRDAWEPQEIPCALGEHLGSLPIFGFV